MNIHCRAIIEMLGAPKEYIEKTLHDYIEKLKREGTRITRETYEEATPSNTLFSNFVELELDFNTPAELLSFCFESMPSTIEVLEPEALALAGKDLTDFLCDLQARLHEADMLVKTVGARYNTLDSTATNVFYNFIKYTLKQSPKTPQEIATILGVTEKELVPFIRELQKKQHIAIENNTCILIEQQKDINL